MPVFEGPEKKVLLRFAPAADARDTGPQSLRSLPQAFWAAAATAAGASILSTARGAVLDAHLLSESSLLVGDAHVALMTCGRTTPLAALPFICAGVRRAAGLVLVSLRYSRAEFFDAAAQPAPHRSWADECAALAPFSDAPRIRVFGKAAGGGGVRFHVWAGAVGEAGRAAAAQDSGLDWRAAREGSSGEWVSAYGPASLEVCMRQPDAAALAPFWKSASATADAALAASALRALIPASARVDPYLFEPCGFSLNAVDDASGSYWSVHVTPEKEAAYVSFETNDPRVAASAVVEAFGARAFVAVRGDALELSR